MNTGFYKVRVCPHCDAVVSYWAVSHYDGKNKVDVKGWLRSGAGSIRHGVCQTCGEPVQWPDEARETIAHWASELTWYLPWTWGNGTWLLKEGMPPEELSRLRIKAS